MTTALVVVGLAAYAAFFLWRVRVEKGYVRPRSFAEIAEAWRRSFAELERVIGSALLPAVEAAAARMAAFAEAFRAASPPEKRSDP